MGDLDSIVLRSSPGAPVGIARLGGPVGGSGDDGSDAFSFGLSSDISRMGSSGGGGCPVSGSASASWRVSGQKKRAEMLREDEASGGSTFHLNKRVSIRKYYEVAHRALLQFRDACDDIEALDDDGDGDGGNVDLALEDLEETYLMGNRLVKFISAVLPTHPQYGSSDPDLVELRDEVKSKLLEAGSLLSDISLLIDRIVHSAYILSDLEGGGIADDDDTEQEEAICGGGNGGSASLLNPSASSIGSADEMQKDVISAAQSDFAAWEVQFDDEGVVSGRVGNDGGGGWANFGSWPAAEAEAATAAPLPPPATATTTSPGQQRRKPAPPSILTSSTSSSPRFSRYSPKASRKNKHKEGSARLRKVSFADDVKPGHDFSGRSTIHNACSSSLGTSSGRAAAAVAAADDDDVSTDDLDISKASSDLLPDEELELEHQTFLRVTQIEFSGGDGGKLERERGHGENDCDDRDAHSHSELQSSRRAVKYDTDEIPTDEDEFANAPQNDVSGSTDGGGADDFLSVVGNDDLDGSSDDDDETSGLSFVQKVALENFMRDRCKSNFLQEDCDSEAEDSWAQEDEDDYGDAENEEDDTATTTDSNLGFDGPLPAFRTDSRDPFFMDRDALWPSDDDDVAVGAFESFGDSDFVVSPSGDDLGGGVRTMMVEGSGGGGTSKILPVVVSTKDDPIFCGASASGVTSGTDETAPTYTTSSQSSYEMLEYDCSRSPTTNEKGIGGRGDGGNVNGAEDPSVPDRLNYLESKLRALRDRNGHLNDSSALREDEVEL